MAAGTANARGARAGGLGLVVSWLPPSLAYNQPPQLAPIPNNPQLAPSRLRGASWQPAQKMRGPRRCERASWQLVATRTSWQLDPPASSQLAPPPQLAARWLALLCGVGGYRLGVNHRRGCENLRTKDQELWSMAVLTKHGSFTGAR